MPVLEILGDDILLPDHVGLPHVLDLAVVVAHLIIVSPLGLVN